MNQKPAKYQAGRTRERFIFSNGEYVITRNREGNSENLSLSGYATIDGFVKIGKESSKCKLRDLFPTCPHDGECLIIEIDVVDDHTTGSVNATYRFDVRGDIEFLYTKEKLWFRSSKVAAQGPASPV